MRLGQTSVVHFLSKIVSSLLGFFATITIARLLGAGILGKYSVALAVVSWLGLAGTMGVAGAITKRVSEQEEPAAYALSGVVLEAALFVLLSLGVLVARQPINDYVGFPAAGFVVAMLGVTLAGNLVSALLNGQHLVHVAGIISPVNTGTRAGLQIAAVVAGFGLAGLFGGYLVGYLVVIVLGAAISARQFDAVSLPQRRHVRDLLSYAKYAWIGGLRSRAFNWVDIALLGFFVESSFVGFYAASWNIAVFLMIFGGSVSQTLFPEMSRLSAKQDPDAVADLLDAGLAYAGLLLIPGLVGAWILGDRLLRIYGPEFVEAELVLVILVVATLVQAYQKQLTSTLNAIDRPDLSFRVNGVFIVGNVLLNLALIYSFGWVGAAVATATSVAFSLILAYAYLSSIVPVRLPYDDIAAQVTAAAIMGVVVYGALAFEETFVGLGHNVAIVLGSVGLGAGVYFLALLVISERFRGTVYDNLPTILSY